MGRYYCKAGAHLKTFISKKGNEVTIRLAKPDDLFALRNYINTLSREDTFIRKSGEIMSLRGEKAYLAEVFLQMRRGNKIKLCVTIENEIVGVADITREPFRSKHVGTLGISIKAGYREEGIGTQMMHELIAESKRLGLRYLQLGVYAPNVLAKHLYEKVGFFEVGRIPEKAVFHGAYVDEIIMYKAL